MFDPTNEEENPMADDPYSRLYHRFKREFPSVYRDKALFGAWVSLLLDADASHPTPPSIPRWVSDDDLERLVSAELVTVEGDVYVIRGLDKERSRRTESARAAGLASAEKRRQRALSERSTSAQLSTGDELDEKSKDETRRDEKDAPALDGGYNEVVKYAERLTGRAYVVPNPYSKMGERVADLVRRHGPEKVCSAFDRIAKALDQAPTINQLVFGAGDYLDPIPRVSKPKSEDDEIAEAVSAHRKRLARG